MTPNHPFNADEPAAARGLTARVPRELAMIGLSSAGVITVMITVLAACASQNVKEQPKNAIEEKSVANFQANEIPIQAKQVHDFSVRINAKIRHYINNQACFVLYHPKIIYDLTLRPTGQLLNDPKLVKSSGNVQCDQAMERAIRRAEPLPIPPDADLFKFFRELRLQFLPNENNQLPNAESGAIPNQTSTSRDPSINQTPSPGSPHAQSGSDLSVESSKVTDDTYYSSNQVNVRPKALTPRQPLFPEKAFKENLGGEVTLQLLIDETGKVRDLAVLTAKPEGYFEQSALDAFRNSLWTPAQKDGHAVKSRVLIRVNFSPVNSP